MWLHESTNHQIRLKVSRSPDPSRFDLPWSDRRCRRWLHPRAEKRASFHPIGRWYSAGILTVRRQNAEPTAIVGFLRKGVEMAFGRRISSVTEEPHANKPLCPRCRGTGRVSERGGRVVCKLCKGTGKVLPAPEPVR